MSDIISVPNERTFRDEVADTLFDLIKEDRDFFAVFYFDNKEDAVVYDSNDIIGFEKDFVKISKSSGDCNVFRFGNVICVDFTVAKKGSNDD